MAPSGAPKPATRRKSKPKFEVPAEVTAAPAAAWVYRHDATAARPPLPVVPPPAGRVPAPPPAEGAVQKPPVEPFGDPTMVMLAAIETIAITVAAANRMFLAAASLMGAPIEVTRKILGL